MGQIICADEENNTMADECLNISTNVEADRRSPTKPAVVEVEQPLAVVEEIGKASPSADRSSPETNCAICLGKPQNKSFTDSCLHQFCFTCLLEWSKVKAECPLCKQSFKSIIHNVRSIEDYEQYYLRPAEPRIPDSLWPTTNERFRTTVSYLQYIIRLDDSFTNNHIIPPAPAPSNSHMVSNWRRRRQNGTSEFRRNIYRQNLYVQRTPDVSGRFRTSSPEFYRLNPAQVHRLVPWLNRELNVLLNENRALIDYVMQIILDLVTRQDIRSPHFHDVLEPYFGERTHHFIHEFHSFATSPFDMIGFDQNAVYVTRDRLAHSIITEVQSSSSDSDSDVQVVGTYTNVETMDRSTSPVAGPSGMRCPTCVDIESDSDDCEIIGTMKPKHERTPEIITLDSESEQDVDPVPDVTVTVKTSYSSDSGVSATEDFEEPSTSYRISTRSQTANRKRKQVFETSDEEYSPPRRHYSRASSGNRDNYYQSRVVWFSGDSESDESSSSSSSSSSNERYGSRKTKKSKGKKKKSPVKKTKRKSHTRESKDSKKRSKVTTYRKKKICSKSEVTTSSSDSSRADSPVIQTSKLRRRSSVRSPSPESNTRNMQEHNYSVPYTTDELKKFVSGRPRLRSVVTIKTEDSPHSSTTHGYTSHENSRLSDVGGSNRRSDSDDDYVSSRHRTSSYSPPRTSQRYESDHSASTHTGTNCVESCLCKYSRPSSSHVSRSNFYNGGLSALYKRAHHSGNSKYLPKKRRRDS